jgi:ribonuclease HI
LQEIGYLKLNAKLLSPFVSPSLWNHQVKMVFNALTTDTRLARATILTAVRGPRTLPYPCYLCGLFPDEIRHLVADECPPVMLARRLICGSLGISLGDDLRTTSLLFPPVTLPLVPLAILAFNRAIWLERTYYLKHLSDPPPPGYTAKRLLIRTLDLIPEGRRRSTSVEVTSFIDSPPPDTILVFTDGSAMPNPGPSGAGVYWQLPTSMGSEEFGISISTGLASNNTGEMSAIYVGALVTDIILDFYDTLFAAFFSDSAISIGHITSGWSFTENVLLGRRARLSMNSLRASGRASLDWVRGHDSIIGNERADGFAKGGALLTREGCMGDDFRVTFPPSFPRLLVDRILETLSRFDFHLLPP